MYKIPSLVFERQHFNRFWKGCIQALVGRWLVEATLLAYRFLGNGVL